MKTNFKKILSLMLALLIVLGMVACGAEEPAADAPVSDAPASDAPAADTPVEATPSAKDDIVIRLSGEPNTLFGMDASDANCDLISTQIAEPLFRYTPEHEIVPAVATAWEYANEEETEILFTLREGIKFNNGDPVTADDVVFSLEYCINSSYCANINGSMDHAEKVSENQVKLVLKYPFAPIIYCFSNRQCPIISKAAYEADPEGFGRAPVTTGPYKVTEWKAGDQIVLDYNEHYWGEAPAIKHATYKIIVDTTSAVVALEAGDIDYCISPGTADREILMANEDIHWCETAQSGTWQIVFCNFGPFADENLRKAVAYCINRDDYVQGCLNGLGEELHMIYSKTAFGYNPEFKGIEQDLEKAKEYLAAAGYADGFEFTAYTQESGNYFKIAEVLQAQLSQIGITMHIEPMERGAYMDFWQSNTHDFGLTFFGNGCAYPDADLWYTFFHSSNIGGSRNRQEINDPKVDELLEAGRFESDPATREQIYWDLCDYWVNEKAYSVPLFSSLSCNASNVNLVGPHEEADGQYYLADWYWAE